MGPSVSPFESNCSSEDCSQCPFAQIFMEEAGKVLESFDLNSPIGKIAFIGYLTGKMAFLSDDCLPYLSSQLGNLRNLTPDEEQKIGLINSNGENVVIRQLELRSTQGTDFVDSFFLGEKPTEKSLEDEPIIEENRITQRNTAQDLLTIVARNVKSKGYHVLEDGSDTNPLDQISTISESITTQRITKQGITKSNKCTSGRKILVGPEPGIINI